MNMRREDSVLGMLAKYWHIITTLFAAVFVTISMYLKVQSHDKVLEENSEEHRVIINEINSLKLNQQKMLEMQDDIKEMKRILYREFRRNN